MIMIIMMATMMIIIIIIIMIRCATLHFNLAPVVCIWVMQLIQKFAIKYIGINVLVNMDIVHILSIYVRQYE